MAGDALRTQYNLLYDGVETLMAKHTVFGSVLRDMKSTLDSLKLLFESMEKYDDVLDQFRVEELEEFRMQMEKGVELIAKLSTIQLWNVYKKFKYANKLLELKESLEKLSNILNIQVARDVKESLISIKKMETMFQTEGFSAVPIPPPIAVGLDVPLRDLKRKLLGNEDVSIHVLTGIGGCGKTTLAAIFCQDQEAKDKFKNIFFVTVSKKAHIELIAQQLYQHTGAQAPTFPSHHIAVQWLQQFLKETARNPLLLVLDDVWPGSESLLENFNIEAPNFKILVTSRSEFPTFGSAYHVKALNDEDAMTLFHHSASLRDKTSHIPEHLVRRVLKHCKGCPLAIVMVGRSLCARPIEIWRKREMEWSKGSSILDYETGLCLCLQRSLDDLEKETAVKECFMDLASFPEDQRISVVALLDMWTELYDLEEEIVIGNIYELTSQNLANNLVVPSLRKEEVEWNGYYSDQFVTQHGLIRELAIYHTKQQDLRDRERLILHISGDNIPRWWRVQMFQPMKARLVSISTDKEFSMKWHCLQLPEAEVLVLNFETDNYALPEFVEKMDRLKVLVLTNYGSLPVELSNLQLLNSVSNLRRIRLERISIGSITNNPIQLNCLQKLSLFMCGIGQAFSNCPIKISDAFPNLEEMNIDYCDDLVELPGELCDLIHLRRLGITNCDKLSALPEGIGQLTKLEVLRLKSCTGLVKFPVSFTNLKKLNILDISGCSSIKELHNEIGEMSNLRKINMRQCSSLQDLPPSVVGLEQLEEVICDEVTQPLWEPFLPKLDKLSVRMIKIVSNLEIHSETSSH